MSNLYITATPIGNLEDITLRALRILKEVDLIASEDTRVTKKLLSHYDIHTPLKSYHANSKKSQEDFFINELRDGKDIALVSDAGTPCISDPGVKLVARVKEELPEINIIPIPGSSALTTALSASGVSSSSFLFLGFLPHKKGRETEFKKIESSQVAVVFYESPHRILKTLIKLKELLADNKKIVIARELTKIYEEFVSGDANEVLEYFEKNPEKVKGEFVVIVSGAK